MSDLEIKQSAVDVEQINKMNTIAEETGEPVFEAGTFAVGEGIADNGKIVNETVTPEVAFKAEETTETVVTKNEEPVYIRDEEEEVITVEKPVDPTDTLKDELPTLIEEEEVRAPEVKEEEKKEKTLDEKKKDLLDRFKSLLSEADVDVWRGTHLNTGDEVKPVSKPIELEANKPILTESVKVISGDVEISKRLDGSISIPADSGEAMVSYLMANPDALGVGEDENSPESRLAVMSMSDANNLIGVDYKYVQEAINEDAAVLKQTLSIPNHNGSVKSRKSVMPKEPGTLTGLPARAAIMDALGLRSHFTIVLPHSGLVAVVAAPVVSEIIDLQYMLDTAKINQGRRYGGSNYGTTTWFINDKIVDLFISKIVKINLRTSTPENIRRHLDPMDIPTIAWGLGCSMYPDGFTFNRTALLDNGKAETVVGKIWLSDMEVFIENRFSTRQKQHLIAANATPSSDEEIESYKRNWIKKEDVPEFERVVSTRETVKKQGTVKKEIILVFGQSNMDDYVEHGASWDNHLSDAINETLSMVSDETIRSGYLSRKIIASSLREYSHLIKKVKIKESYSFSDDVIISEIDSSEVILGMLDDITATKEVREKTLEAIKEYINSTVKVIYGVPTASDYEDKHNSSPLSNKIVPVNTVIAFFTLIAQTYRSLEIPTEI